MNKNRYLEAGVSAGDLRDLAEKVFEIAFGDGFQYPIYLSGVSANGIVFCICHSGTEITPLTYFDNGLGDDESIKGPLCVMVNDRQGTAECIVYNDATIIGPSPVRPSRSH